MKVLPPDPPLAADGILLRPFELSDAPAIAEACQDAEIVRYLPVPAPYTEQDAVDYVTAVPEGFEDGTSLQFAGEDTDGTFLGSFGLGRPNATLGTIEVGYWVAPWARGRGAATTAVRLLSRWALTDLGYARVELEVAVDNVASRRVAAKAGFTEEGVLRERQPMRDGGRRDLVLCGLLAREIVPAG